MVVVGLLAALTVALPAAPAGATTTILTGSVAAGTSTQFVGRTFSVDVAGTVNISTDWDNPSANLNVFLYDPTNTVVASSTSPTAKPELLSYGATLVGTYRLGVKALTGSANFTATVNTPSATTGTVSGRMWDDLNGNGVQDAGESSGPSGLTVQLLDSGGVTRATTTTATGGTYTFSAVPVGSYRVALSIPAGYTMSPQGQGGNPATDSDLDPTTGQSALVAVNANASTTVDGGIASRPSTTQQTWNGTIDSSGANWAQTNFTASAAGPINISVDWNNAGANLNVFLYSGATVVAQSLSTTAKPETLTYNGVAPGTYKLGVKALSGGVSSFTATITTPIVTSTVAGTVWQDANGDGIRNEAGRIAGATVDLRQGASTLQSTVTAADGTYRFPMLTPGSYSVLVHLTTGYAFSPQAQGSDPTVDSDVDATGASASLTVAGGATRTFDAGFAPSQTELGPFNGTVSSSGTSWLQYFVTPPANGVLTVTLTWPAGADLNLYAYNAANTAIGIANSSAANPETFQLYVTGGAQYRLGVKAVSGSAAFTLSAQWGVGGAPASPPVAAAYTSTIGGPGRAQMYPSGFDVGPDGTVYAADTGNDHVKAYNPDGSLKWDAGTISVRQNGSFGNPRDLAYYNGSVYVADTVFNRVQVLDAATGAYQSQWTGFTTILGITTGVDAGGQPVILVTEDSSSRTRIFKPDGTFVRTIGGVAGAGNGQLTLPRDAATDSAGNVYVADYGNNRIAKFSPTGTWLLNFGTRGSGNGQMRSPYGVAIDPLTNTVYVADSNNNRIDVFDANGGFLRIIGGPGTGNGQFSDMRRVALGPGANPDVYGADFWAYRVERFANDGTFLQSFGNVPPPTQGFNEPGGITADGTALFIADTTNQRVERYAFDGTWQQTWGSRGFGTGNSGFAWESDLTIAASGLIYVADTRNSRVTEFDRNGVPTGREFGSVGSAIGQMNWPYGIDAAGNNFVVADTQNNRVQLWDTSTSSVVWNAGGFNNPGDVAVWNNRVYVADSGNRRIVVLSLTDGSVIKVVPNGGMTGATGVAVDPSGNIWVVDGNQSRVLELTDTGVILQSFGTWGTGNNNFAAPTRAFIVTTGGVSTLYVADQDNDRVQAIRIS